MTSRELILDRVRRNQPAPRPMPAVPTFDKPIASLLETFIVGLERMGGVVVEAPTQLTLDELIRQRFPSAQVICSATPELQGTRALSSVRHPAELEDVDVGVVRALFGVAETGSVFLSEREYGINALGFLPQHLVVLLDPQTLVPNLHHAYRQRAFHEARYGVLMTGPSATADIEGVLIRGAQGIRTFTLIPLAQPAG